MPRVEIEKVWAGLGKGRQCAACDQVITAAEIEHEAEVADGSVLRFHRTCFAVWQQEVPKWGREITGGSAGPFVDATPTERNRAAYEELRAATVQLSLIVAATHARARRALTAAHWLSTRRSAA